jgi:hypothetical protein
MSIFGKFQVHIPSSTLAVLTMILWLCWIWGYYCGDCEEYRYDLAFVASVHAHFTFVPLTDHNWKEWWIMTRFPGRRWSLHWPLIAMSQLQLSSSFKNCPIKPSFVLSIFSMCLYICGPSCTVFINNMISTPVARQHFLLTAIEERWIELSGDPCQDIISLKDILVHLTGDNRERSSYEKTGEDSILGRLSTCVHAVVNYRVHKMVIALELLVFTAYV